MIIPFDLFPRRKALINTKWAKETFKYYSMFDQDVMMIDNPSIDQVNKWIFFAKLLFDYVRGKAHERIMKEIVLVANRYQLQTIKKTKIISFEDVLRLYQDKEWYYSKLQNNRDYLYIFQYGLLRSGTDMWVDEVVQEFVFKKYNVVYEKLESKGKKKGCFHKLVLNSAGDFIASRLQRVCTKYLGEYVCSRCPQTNIQNTNNRDTTATNKNKIQHAVPHVFLNYHKGYIVKTGEETLPADCLNSMTKQLVQYSKMSSISLSSLKEKIDNYWNDTGKWK